MRANAFNERGSAYSRGCELLRGSKQRAKHLCLHTSWSPPWLSVSLTIFNCEKRSSTTGRANGFLQRATPHSLAFSRRQSLTPQSVNANVLIEPFLQIVKHAVGNAIDVVTKFDPGLGEAFVDPGQLETAILNLAINARDAMSGQGTLTIVTDNKPSDGLDSRHPQNLSSKGYQRYRMRNERGRPVASIRAVFHHQAERQGNRPRPQPGLWLCQTIWGSCQYRFNDRPGHNSSSLPASRGASQDCHVTLTRRSAAAA
ncbi:hypothetical protein [Mesorhizobium carmichaelinearum]|uniref:hypothetical protein n=1 Tax=Mesorhizobium carmichaelinearum TaxID=1208188 RepID=UPI001FCE6739|nr:hypothetical protein [Mesorhizobium carmichaelinearum]